VSAAFSRLVPVAIDGPAGTLEALLQERAGEPPSVAAVVCHPHPLYGGTMHNKVVHRTASALHGLGAAVLRFNFRGVGASAGTHDHGAGELDDARAALAHLRARFPAAQLWVAGFSFGSWIAARLAAADATVERLILIAPPVRTASFEVLHSLATPKLVVQGMRDDTCPPEALEAEYPAWSEPKELVRIDGATHFFDRQLGPLAHALEERLRPHVPMRAP
jgi:alpha/beta superfamily hydrolase